MARLPLSINEIPGEAATSVASRLAHANGVQFREFLQDMGISVSGLLGGQDEDLEVLADISGIGLVQLRQNTPLIGRNTSWFRQEAFPSSAMDSSVVRGCPECLQIAPAIQGIWMLPFISICAQHGRPLVELWSGPRSLDIFDVAMRIQGVDLSKLCAEETREPTSFELWVAARLDETSDQEIWLDGFDLVSVSSFCAELGRAAIATRIPKSRKLQPDHAWWPLDVGFSLCVRGEETLSCLLAELQGLMGRPELGPRKIFGGLHDLLASDPCPEGLWAFREHLRSHIIATWPLAPGDEVLGEPVLRRDRMSISSAAALLAGRREKFLEELQRDGIAVSLDQPEAWQIFGFADATEALVRLNNGLERDAFCGALSLSARQFAELEQDGLVVAGETGRFDPLAAQALVDGLLIGAEPVYVALHDWCNLMDAAKRLRLTLPQLIGDIQRGRFLRIGKYVPKTGFASVLVNLGHLGQEDEAISMEAFAAGLGLRTTELVTFYRRNDLPHRRVKGPRGGAQSRLSTGDRIAFLEHYISFRSLGVGAGVGWDELTARLEDDGIAPVGGSTRIYDRAAVAHILE